MFREDRHVHDVFFTRVADLQHLVQVLVAVQLAVVERNGHTDGLPPGPVPAVDPDGLELVRGRQRRLEVNERLAPLQLVDVVAQARNSPTLGRAKVEAALRAAHVLVPLLDEDDVAARARARQEEVNVELVFLGDVVKLRLVPQDARIGDNGDGEALPAGLAVSQVGNRQGDLAVALLLPGVGVTLAP